MSEILAPAGNKNSALAAINAGADAIYLGLSQFSARSSAENFDLESFKEISGYAHVFGVKVYVAMNTLIKDGELESFLEALIEVWNVGADAIIISDIYLGKFIKRNYPQIILHLSTQAGICNSYGAELAKKFGFDRVILSRETEFKDIEAIAKIIETEVFVQGALCTCFSGQCYLSSFAGGNSGNRGRCKQPCRKLYSIDRKGYDDYAYRLSLSDLSVGEYVEKLVNIGVTSFKIEGRMRRPEYVAAAVNYYRNLLDNCSNPSDLSLLKRTYNRGNYTKGLAFGQDKSFISSAVQGHIGEFVGVLKVISGKYFCQSNQEFEKGDGFKILREGKEVGGADYSESTRGGFFINSKSKLRSGDKVFITTDVSANQELLNFNRKIHLKVSARFVAGERACITVNGKEFFGESVLTSAVNSPLTKDEIKKCFDKVDKFPFEIAYSSIETDGVFIARSELNALRRSVYDEVYKNLSANSNSKVFPCHTLPTINNEKNEQIAAICTDLSMVDAQIGIFKPQNYNSISDINFTDFSGLKFLYLPPFMTDSEIESIKPHVNSFDGIYCDGIWAVAFAEQINKPLFLGCGANVSNRVAVSECQSEYVALSKELTAQEQKSLSKNNTFALSSGAIKVMDLIYCPFGRKCKDCDKKSIYNLTDEDGRKFPLRRYETSLCRFEVFNCAKLVGNSCTGTLVDCTLEVDAQTAVDNCKDVKKQQNYFKNYTYGHGNSPII